MKYSWDFPTNGNQTRQAEFPLSCPPVEGPSSGVVGRKDNDPVSNPLARWFALLVKPRHEKAVMRGLEGKGFESFLPMYSRRHRYAARSRVFELPLFPRYVFCRFDLNARLPVVTTPGVVRVLGVGRLPLPVEDSEIASLQTVIAVGLPMKPFPFWKVGQKVSITDGPLAGAAGIVMRVSESLSLVLSITLLQRSVLVEIDADQVSPLLGGQEPPTLGTGSREQSGPIPRPGREGLSSLPLLSGGDS